MHRIDTSTAQVDKFGSGKNGFTGGNPQTGELPTALDADFFDSVQEEIAGVIEAAGLTLSKSNNAQLLAGINKLVGSGRLLSVKAIASSGTYTPSSGAKSLFIECIGGGGGGGGCVTQASGNHAAAGGGGAGGYACAFLSSIAASYTISIGNGGAGGGTSGASGVDGGVTSFGTVCVASGGAGGSGGNLTVATANSVVAAGGNSGIATTGMVSFGSSEQGQQGIGTSNGNIGGGGGSSKYGRGGIRVGTASGAAAGNNATGYGAGGGGSAIGSSGGSGVSGGTAGGGIVTVWEYS